MVRSNFCFSRKTPLISIHIIIQIQETRNWFLLPRCQPALPELSAAFSRPFFYPHSVQHFASSSHFYLKFFAKCVKIFISSGKKCVSPNRAYALLRFFDTLKRSDFLSEQSIPKKSLTVSILSLFLLTVMAGAAVAPALGVIQAHFADSNPLFVQMIISVPALFIVITNFIFSKNLSRIRCKDIGAHRPAALHRGRLRCRPV